jgi:hypothetical protein
MAIAYSILVIIGMAAFLPSYGHLPLPLSLLVLVPAVIFARSVKIMLSGHWRKPEQLEASAVSAFVAMLLIPVSLTIAFLLDALVR